MTSIQIVALLTTLTDLITEVVTDTLPLVLAIFGGLVGLGIALHFVRRFIGRRA